MRDRTELSVKPQEESRPRRINQYLLNTRLPILLCNLGTPCSNQGNRDAAGDQDMMWTQEKYMDML